MNIALTLIGETVLLLFLWVFSKKTNTDTLRKSSTVIMAFYILGVLYITLINRTVDADIGVRLIPFKTYYELLRDVFRALVNGDWTQIEYTIWSGLILNILLLVPFGILVPIVTNSKASAVKLILAGAIFSFSIEFLQLLTRRGWFDVDDIINNTLGAFIGVKLHRKTLSKKGT